MNFSGWIPAIVIAALLAFGGFVIAWSGGGGAPGAAAPPVVDVGACSSNSITVDSAADLVQISQAGAVDCSVTLTEARGTTGRRQTICASTITGGANGLLIVDQPGLIDVGGSLLLAAGDCLQVVYAISGVWIPVLPVAWRGGRSRTVSSNTTATLLDHEGIVRVMRPAGIGVNADVQLPDCTAATSGFSTTIVSECSGACLGNIRLVGAAGALLRGLLNLSLTGNTGVTVKCDGAGNYLSYP